MLVPFYNGNSLMNKWFGERVAVDCMWNFFKCPTNFRNVLKIHVMRGAVIFFEFLFSGFHGANIQNFRGLLPQRITHP
jgi:hypothetical protein